MGIELAVLIGLAAYRLSRLIARDSILRDVRHRFYRRFPPSDDYARYYRLARAAGKGRQARGQWQVGEVARRRISWLGRLVDCPWCSSVWFAAAITGALTRYVSVPVPVLIWAASCSIAGICAKIGDL